MRQARHGLVIGKFYPPHAGHHLLVRVAAACSERVTVVVAASSVESIPLSERVVWMREVHEAPTVRVVGAVDDHPVDLGDDAVWRAHVEIFRAAAASAWPEPVDAVFTSEAYGPELARRLGARHAAVDPDRSLVAMSATQVRMDPVASWAALSPPVRGALAMRVVLVGAESTGKTTLAEALCADLRARGGVFSDTRWVPEVGRAFTVDKLAIARAAADLRGVSRPELAELCWSEEDFLAIAAAQQRSEDAEARGGGPVLVCDTDAFATGVWHHRYRGERSLRVESMGRASALYLLSHPDDVPFAQDGLRDGEHVRRWMTDAFVERLEASGRAWRWVRGDLGARRAAALAAIDERLARGWKFADPWG